MVYSKKKINHHSLGPKRINPLFLQQNTHFNLTINVSSFLLNKINFLKNCNKTVLTFRCIHPFLRMIVQNFLQLKILYAGKMMQLQMVVVFLKVLQLDHLMLDTLYVQHKLDVNSIHCLNNRSYHLFWEGIIDDLFIVVCSK